ncbi:hypothetical protein ACFPYJ_09990 [Paenibacillus solisilvae]|uniref:Galactose mutarotase n=1 Tax=Paenibacillus solisilvae TaxID=2486751 RepID=A0ABW0VWT0_9BACL
MGRWTKENQEGYDVWAGETDAVSIRVIPELGSKVISLVNRRSNREWLWRSGKALGNQGFGSSFGASDESGWDEMFPSINECLYPEAPWMGNKIPDHGEVWSSKWQASCTEGELHCRVEGVCLPYSLEKRYSFVSENILRMDYTLTNRSDSPFSFLWAAHPLFRIHEGMRLNVPGELSEIETSYSQDQRLGVFQDKLAWPIIESEQGMLDLRLIESADSKSAEKYYFTGKLELGMAQLSDPATGEAVTLRFPAETVPYLAVWANYGGFGGHYHLAIEPATGRMDDLAHAVLHNEAAVIGAHGTYRWFLEMEITS